MDSGKGPISTHGQTEISFTTSRVYYTNIFIPGQLIGLVLVCRNILICQHPKHNFMKKMPTPCHTGLKFSIEISSSRSAAILSKSVFIPFFKCHTPSHITLWAEQLTTYTNISTWLLEMHFVLKWFMPLEFSGMIWQHLHAISAFKRDMNKRNRAVLWN